MESGTYQLTTVVAYGTSNPVVTTSTVKGTLQITGAEWLRGFYFSAFGQESVGSEGGTFTTDATAITATTTCTEGASNGGYGTFGGAYTATATTLTFLQDAPAQAGGGTIAFTLTKQ